jgi:osmotically-inducible protein OsmY
MPVKDSERRDPIKALKAILTDRLHIDARTHPVKLRMEGEAVVMEGVVERISQKKRALLAAMRMDGVSGAVDRLKVAPSKAMSDAETKRHVLDALDEEQTLNGLAIEVAVSGGVVDLEGTVPSLSHKRLAGVLAWWVPGSAEVINSLDVDPAEEDSDGEVEDALRIVLEKDPMVDAGSIRAVCRDWVVTLDGVARSMAERDAAEDDAWYTWGVNDVVNGIRVEKKGV